MGKQKVSTTKEPNIPHRKGQWVNDGKSMSPPAMNGKPTANSEKSGRQKNRTKHSKNIPDVSVMKGAVKDTTSLIERDNNPSGSDGFGRRKLTDSFD